MSGAQERVGGLGDFEQRNAPSGPHDPRQFGEERFEFDEVAQREPTRHAVDDAVGYGKAEGIALHERRVGACGREHPPREIDTDGSQAALGELAAEVAGAAREVEYA